MVETEILKSTGSDESTSPAPRRQPEPPSREKRPQGSQKSRPVLGKSRSSLSGAEKGSDEASGSEGFGSSSDEENNDQESSVALIDNVDVLMLMEIPSLGKHTRLKFTVTKENTLESVVDGIGKVTRGLSEASEGGLADADVKAADAELHRFYLDASSKLASWKKDLEEAAFLRRKAKRKVEEMAQRREQYWFEINDLRRKLYGHTMSENATAMDSLLESCPESAARIKIGSIPEDMQEVFRQKLAMMNSDYELKMKTLLIRQAELKQQLLSKVGKEDPSAVTRTGSMRHTVSSSELQDDTEVSSPSSFSAATPRLPPISS
jgi:hypothetical protein